jgi:hypothetical protein
MAVPLQEGVAVLPLPSRSVIVQVQASYQGYGLFFAPSSGVPTLTRPFATNFS